MTIDCGKSGEYNQISVVIIDRMLLQSSAQAIFAHGSHRYSGSALCVRPKESAGPGAECSSKGFVYWSVPFVQGSGRSRVVLRGTVPPSKNSERRNLRYLQRS